MSKEYWPFIGKSALCRVEWAWRSRRTVSLILVSLLAGFLNTGCAKQQNPPSALIHPHTPSATGAPEKERAYAEVDMESDGMEAQQPPLIQRDELPDDPSEPYSPNYGRDHAERDDQNGNDVAENRQDKSVVTRIRYDGTEPIFTPSQLR